MSKVFTDAGGFDIIKPGQRVLLKLNLLNAAPVERAVTTHPEITRALIRLVKNAGGVPVAGDAPGLDLPGMGRKVLKTSGTLAVCQQEDIPAVVFTDKGYDVVTLESNVKLKSIHIAREILELIQQIAADDVISSWMRNRPDMLESEDVRTGIQQFFHEGRTHQSRPAG